MYRAWKLGTLLEQEMYHAWRLGALCVPEGYHFWKSDGVSVLLISYLSIFVLLACDLLYIFQKTWQTPK